MHMVLADFFKSAKKLFAYPFDYEFQATWKGLNMWVLCEFRGEVVEGSCDELLGPRYFFHRSKRWY